MVLLYAYFEQFMVLCLVLSFYYLYHVQHFYLISFDLKRLDLVEWKKLGKNVLSKTCFYILTFFCLSQNILLSLFIYQIEKHPLTA